MITNSSHLLKRRTKLQTEFDLITSTDAERLLLRSLCTLFIYYEYSDKANRLLAHQLYCQAASWIIIKLKIYLAP